MASMFSGAARFNRDIGSWDVKRVKSMYTMFQGARSFNQDIGRWDVDNCDRITGMFERADAFDRTFIRKWKKLKEVESSNQLDGDKNTQNKARIADMAGRLASVGPSRRQKVEASKISSKISCQLVELRKFDNESGVILRKLKGLREEYKRIVYPNPCFNCKGCRRAAAHENDCGRCYPCRKWNFHLKEESKKDGPPVVPGDAFKCRLKMCVNSEDYFDEDGDYDNDDDHNYEEEELEKIKETRRRRLKREKEDTEDDVLMAIAMFTSTLKQIKRSFVSLEKDILPVLRKKRGIEGGNAESKSFSALATPKFYSEKVMVRAREARQAETECFHTQRFHGSTMSNGIYFNPRVTCFARPRSSQMSH